MNDLTHDIKVQNLYTSVTYDYKNMTWKEVQEWGQMKDFRITSIRSYNKYK